MDTNQLTLVNVSAGYGHSVVLRNINVTISRGEVVALLGRNGAGKSTLLNTIQGRLGTKDGRITYNNKRLDQIKILGRVESGISLVPQERGIFPSLTVEENILSGVRGKVRDELDEMYRLFPRLRERSRNMGGQLSGGEQQMLCIARALVSRPTLLLLDEPLEGLAPNIRQQLIAALKAIVSEGTITTVIAEQQVSDIADFVGRVIVLGGGEVTYDNDIEQVKGNLEDLIQQIGLI